MFWFTEIKHEYLRSRAYICHFHHHPVIFLSNHGLSRYSCLHLGSLYPRVFFFNKAEWNLIWYFCIQQTLLCLTTIKMLGKLCQKQKKFFLWNFYKMFIVFPSFSCFIVQAKYIIVKKLFLCWNYWKWIVNTKYSRIRVASKNNN